MSDLHEDCQRWATLMDRSALGEPLGPEDAAFCERHAASHPECAREQAVYAELALLDASPNAESRTLVDAALARMEAEDAERSVAEAVTFRKRRVPVFGLVASALSAAAAGLLFVGAPASPAERADGDLRGPQPARPSRTELVYASGAVRVSGKPASLGRTLLEEGNVIETELGTACVLIDPDINVCLSEHTVLRLSQLDAKARKLDLLRGKTATRLATQPEGMSLSIAAGDVLSTAVGTAFSVERAADGGVITTVLNGKVRVGRDHDTRIVTAHERAVVTAVTRGVPVLTTVSRSEEAPSWALLGPTALWHDPISASLDLRGEPEHAEAYLDGQRIGIAPLSTLVPVGTHRLVVRAGDTVLLERELHMNAGETQLVAYRPPAVAEPSPGPAATKTVALRHEKPVEAAQESAKALTAEELGLRDDAPSAVAERPADLLAQARRLMREGRYAEAEQSYEAIGRAFPGSEEAHAVLVSLGQLELVQLGAPQRALSRFDAYLARGGALSEEARAARILTLRKLGREREEASAIREFLAKHPRSFETAQMRARLLTLETAR